jgi:hypothetical protein
MQTQQPAAPVAWEKEPVIELLLSGRARTVEEAEELYLDTHLDDVIRLVEGPLSEAEFRRHPLIVLLMSHGSRAREDSPW